MKMTHEALPMNSRDIEARCQKLKDDFEELHELMEENQTFCWINELKVSGVVVDPKGSLQLVSLRIGK